VEANIMAAKTKKASKPAVEWVIPIKFMDDVEEVFFPLSDEILEEAIARAQTRGGTPFARVTADDVIDSAQVIVAAVMTKLHKKLKPSEANRARIKAS
jgi:hypothetical protein